ncbi:PPP family 3-phenylpropionic acid transporter [Plasticicumulans lactativorans]|uniref:PPP family 3-phenylpropionic acid transporter n=1 Tax=Plasticicumulans lactativorans TaxID=1133106 RepID=A0A4R2LBV6_9GAMM|nr:MFS transporter [Plasticicumulans lactativorans]TCO81795.1 PPP family 3-phenylpropionic acid transporter [Plasticicumulans lactativorans]
MRLRLSAYYFLALAASGIFTAFWPLYLQSRGFGVGGIGLLVGLATGTRVVVPSLWGWVADRSGRHMGVVRVAGAIAVLIFPAVMLSAAGPGGLTLASFLFMVCSPGTLSQVEVTTLGHMGADTGGYGRVRLWGSLGFIAAVSGLAPLVEHFGVQIVPALLAALLLCVWLTSLGIAEAPHAAAAAAAPGGGLGEVLRRPEVLAILGVTCAMQLAHGPYSTFYTIYLREHGYGATAIGALWGLAVVAEICAFLLVPTLWRRYTARELLLGAIALSVLRWLLIAGAAEHPLVLMAAQTLHAASFGVCHTVAIQLVLRWFGPRHAGQGQALYASAGGGLGTALGAGLAGLLWPRFGGASTFVLASAVTALAWVAAQRWVRGPGAERPLSRA